jgi:hypothetical protein
MVGAKTVCWRLVPPILLLSTGSHLGDKPQFTGTLYFQIHGVREYLERVRHKAGVVWPLEATDYGQLEFGIRDCDGYTVAFSETIDEK